MDIGDSIKKEGLRRRLSPRTIKTYYQCIKKFFNYCLKEPKKVTKKDIREFLDNLIEKGASGSTVNIYLNSLKFYFENLLGKRMKLNIKYSKKPKRLPVVLTQEETKKFIKAINNKEHKLMIELMYSAGLRVSELIKLKVKDLEMENNYGWVRQGKGGKDRIFIIADRVKRRLRAKVKDSDYNSWLFKGNFGHISQRTIQEIVKKAAKKAEIRKNIHCHTLRHSFATHLIENEYSVSEVQSLLGHNSPQTTMMYVHMSNPKLINIRSPLDEL